MDGEPVIPAPLDDDDGDVAWALQTAAVQWQRGARADAVVWLRRAVDAAILAGSSARTQDLTRLAASVADRLVSEAMAAPDSVAPPSPGRARGADVDNLLSLETSAAPSPHRATAESLTGEIPIEFEDAEDDEDFEQAEDDEGFEQAEDDEDDEDDDAPTIPPPSRGEPAREAEHEPFGAQPDPESHSLRPAGEIDLFGVPPPQPESLGIPPIAEHAAALPHESGAAPLESTESPPRVQPFSLPPALDPDGAYRSRAASPPAPTHAAIDLELQPTSSPPDAGLEADLDEPPTLEHVFSPGASAAAAPPVEVATTVVDGVSLEAVRGFEDLPEEAQHRLAASAVLTPLSADEEVGAFGAALVTRGRVGIMPAIADVAAAVAASGEVVFTRGTLDESVSLRAVALEDDTMVASWSPAELAAVLSDCPWVADELRLVADRFQALAGAALGPLGDRLDDALRTLVLSRLEVKALAPGEVVATAGKPIPGLFIVGAGHVDLVKGDAVIGEASPGDFVFASEVLSAGAAPATAQAGTGGALLLWASRSLAHELMMSVPPLLEILAG